ncbi:unnamed protein product [Symbiodinium sp. KB8]|nr:unnamed protein product [Symbiodinium sp. KB8]
MGDRGGQKRKLEELAKGLGDLKTAQQQQQEQLNSLQTRVDRIEKSTTLVIEHSVQVEAAYKQAEDTRDFKRLSKLAAKVLGAELGPKVQLPYPLPTESPEQWSTAEVLEGPQYEPACEIARLDWEHISTNAIVSAVRPVKETSCNQGNRGRGSGGACRAVEREVHSWVSGQSVLEDCLGHPQEEVTVFFKGKGRGGSVWPFLVSLSWLDVRTMHCQTTISLEGELRLEGVAVLMDSEIQEGLLDEYELWSYGLRRFAEEQVGLPPVVKRPQWQMDNIVRLGELSRLRLSAFDAFVNGGSKEAYRAMCKSARVPVSSVAAVHKLKNGKATAGPDGLQPEILKCFDMVNLRVLHEHISRVWRGLAPMPDEWLENYLASSLCGDDWASADFDDVFAKNPVPQRMSMCLLRMILHRRLSLHERVPITG